MLPSRMYTEYSLHSRKATRLSYLYVTPSHFAVPAMERAQTHLQAQKLQNRSSSQQHAIAGNIVLPPNSTLKNLPPKHPYVPIAELPTLNQLTFLQAPLITSKQPQPEILLSPPTHHCTNPNCNTMLRSKTNKLPLHFT